LEYVSVDPGRKVQSDVAVVPAERANPGQPYLPIILKRPDVLIYVER